MPSCSNPAIENENENDASELFAARASGWHLPAEANHRCDGCLHLISRWFKKKLMTSYLTPEQAPTLYAGGNTPMQIVDPSTRGVYYVIAAAIKLKEESKCSF